MQRNDVAVGVGNGGDDENPYRQINEGIQVDNFNREELVQELLNYDYSKLSFISNFLVALMNYLSTKNVKIVNVGGDNILGNPSEE